MASAVDICNQALGMLGSFLIASLTEDSKAAKLCNNQYEATRDAVFRSYPWNCLMTRQTLAETATTPTWGYEHQYTLPTDPFCLRVLNMEEHDDDSEVDFVIEGRLLLTDADSCNILYIGRVTDPNQYDVLLQDALAAKLASDIAYSLTGNANLVRAMYDIYLATVRQARSVDAQEGVPRVLIEDTWLNARE